MFVALTNQLKKRLQKNKINFSKKFCNLIQLKTVKEEMTSTNHQEIIKKVIQGDVNAFATLVDNYKDMVFGLGYKMTKNREEAEEITQDTFIKAFKNLSNFPSIKEMIE